ncbi:MAG: hypothetical protein IJ677_02805 [Alphaproteobacteria bacterium]|nr:hypothetical protein [Alphaproteobacteria bacterium]
MNYTQVAEIKNVVMQKYGENIHFHDTCGGGAYFSLERNNYELEEFLKQYFTSRGMVIKFSKDGTKFSVE